MSLRHPVVLECARIVVELASFDDMEVSFHMCRSLFIYVGRFSQSSSVKDRRRAC